MHKRFIGFFLVASLLLSPMLIGNVMAESLDVSAQVNALLPPSGEVPIVQLPNNNSVVDIQNIFVSGKCVVVDPALIVMLVRENQVIGSGPCLADGTFKVLVGLVQGVNTIYPKFITITGQFGGIGQPVIVTYNPPVTNTTTQQNVDTNGEGLKLIFDYNFVNYDDATPTDVAYQVLGGSKPYFVTVNWGDGTQTTEKISSNDLRTMKHQYLHILPDASITITAVDSLGAKVVQSRALVSFKKGIYTPAAQPVSKISPVFTTPQKVWIGLGSFSILALFINRFGVASILSRFNVSKNKFR